MRDTEVRTEGRVTLEPGNLYRALRRLQGRAWVEKADRRADPDRGDERRRYYRITELGRRVARQETLRMTELVEMARASALSGPE